MLKSPAKILVLWNRTVKKHEDGKEVKELPRKGQEQKTRIKKDLTTLKQKAAKDLTRPDAREAFLRARDRLFKIMSKYCRYLKAAKDEDKKVLPRYLKMVKQLTVLVQKLDPGDLDLSEGDAALEELDAVDTAKLDQTLEQPDTEEDVELEEEEAEEVPVPPPPPADEAAAFNARLKALLPRAIEAQKNNPSIATDVKLALSEAQVFGRKHDFAQANVLLDRVDSLLGHVPSAPPLPDTAKAALMKRLNALTPNVKAALTANGPDVPQIQHLFGSIKGLMDKHEFAQVGKILDELEHLLTQGKTESVPPPPPLPASDKASLMKRLNALTADIKAALAAKGPNANRIQTLFTTIPGLLDKHDYTQANAALDQLEALLHESGETEEEEEEEEAEAPPVETLPLWIQAKETVDSQLSKLQNALRQRNDAEFKRIADYGLNGITRRLQVGLQVALREFDGAQSATRAKARNRARAAVADFMTFLQSDPVVALMDSNPITPITLKATLGKALKSISQALSD